jgi:hypothetical protein
MLLPMVRVHCFNDERLTNFEVRCTSGQQEIAIPMVYYFPREAVTLTVTASPPNRAVLHLFYLQFLANSE